MFAKLENFLIPVCGVFCLFKIVAFPLGPRAVCLIATQEFLFPPNAGVILDLGWVLLIFSAWSWWMDPCKRASQNIVMSPWWLQDSSVVLEIRDPQPFYLGVSWFPKEVPHLQVVVWLLLSFAEGPCCSSQTAGPAAGPEGWMIILRGQVQFLWSLKGESLLLDGCRWYRKKWNNARV